MTPELHDLLLRWSYATNAGFSGLADSIASLIRKEVEGGQP